LDIKLLINFEKRWATLLLGCIVAALEHIGMNLTDAKQTNNLLDRKAEAFGDLSQSHIRKYNVKY
jgi:hypothetical protein